MSVPVNNSGDEEHEQQQAQGPPQPNGDINYNTTIPLTATTLAMHNAYNRAANKSRNENKKEGNENEDISPERRPRNFRFRTYAAWRMHKQPEPSKGVRRSPPTNPPPPAKIPYVKPIDKTFGLSSTAALALRVVIRRREDKEKERQNKRINEEQKLIRAGIIVKTRPNAGERRGQRRATDAKSPLSSGSMVASDEDEGGNTDVEGEDGPKESVAGGSKPLKRQRTEIAVEAGVPGQQGEHKHGEGNHIDGPPSAKRARFTVSRPGFKARKTLARTKTITADVEMTD